MKSVGPFVVTSLGELNRDREFSSTQKEDDYSPKGGSPKEHVKKFRPVQSIKLEEIENTFFPKQMDTKKYNSW